MKGSILALSLLFLAAEAEAQPRIEGLHVNRQDDGLLVSFELTGAFDEPTLERLQSGLPTEFQYIVRLERPRRWWFDRRYDRTTMQVVAMYNALTEEYLINYKQDGRLVDSRVISDPRELEPAMTMINSLQAFELPRQVSGRWYVKVRAELGSRRLMLLFPRTVATNWGRARLDQLAPGG